MEAWYPIDGTSEVLMTATIMENAASTSGIANARMIAILDGTEAMLYGGGDSIKSNTINYRYNLAKNEWILFGNILNARAAFGALAIEGIEC
jgi:hypothetical protein